MIWGTAGSTSFFLKKSCLETKRFSRFAWRESDVVRPKTVEGRKDLQSFSKHSGTPITRVTMRPVSGLAILSLNPSLQMKLTDDYAAGNTDAHKRPVDERYRLFASINVGTKWAGTVSFWFRANLMKSLVTLALIAATCASLAQEGKSAASPRWANVSSNYRRFEEIKPKFVNSGEVSIFLSRLWPNGAAQLERFNQDTGEWESGDWGITCGTVAQATVPIEIKPHSEQEIQVYWQLSTDKWENPQHFVVFHSTEQRPLGGKYRFVLRYALQPWTLVHHPSATYNFTSLEFVLTP